MLRSLMVMTLLCVSVLGLVATAEAADPTHTEIKKMKKVLDAIRKVETGGMTADEAKNAKGKDGELGPYQIKKSYFKDSGVKGRYEQVKDKKFAEKVVVAYMKRYATIKRIGRPVTPSDKARIHKGGPTGYKKSSTLGYRTKFLRHYGSSN